MGHRIGLKKALPAFRWGVGMYLQCWHSNDPVSNSPILVGAYSFPVELSCQAAPPCNRLNLLLLLYCFRWQSEYVVHSCIKERCGGSLRSDDTVQRHVLCVSEGLTFSAINLICYCVCKKVRLIASEFCQSFLKEMPEILYRAFLQKLGAFKFWQYLQFSTDLLSVNSLGLYFLCRNLIFSVVYFH